MAKARPCWSAWLLAVATLAAPADAGETTIYRYDALGRLVSSTSSGTVNNGLATTIGYDPAGNRQSYHVVTGAGGGGIPTVIDGSFEDPPQNGGYTYTPTVSGATFTGGAGVAGNGSAWGFAAAPVGSQVAFIAGAPEGHGAITLGVSGLTPGVAYSVRFYTAQRPGYGGAPITVSFNGTGLGTFTAASTAFTQVTTASFTATATTGTLTFDGSLTAVYTASAIDSVTVVPGGPSAADGSFEDPVQASAGYTYTPTVSGATFTGGAGVAANGSAWSFAPAPNGNQAAFIAGAPEGHGTIALSVGGLTPGATYSVHFYVTQRPGYGPNPINVSFNGTALGTFTPASTSFAQVVTASFTASTATGTLTFDGTLSATTTVAGIDAVTLAPGP